MDGTGPPPMAKENIADIPTVIWVKSFDYWINLTYSNVVQVKMTKEMLEKNSSCSVCWEVIWSTYFPFMTPIKKSLIFFVRTSPRGRRWRNWSVTTASILVASCPGLSYMAPALSAGKNSVVLLLQVSPFSCFTWTWKFFNNPALQGLKELQPQTLPPLILMRQREVLLLHLPLMLKVGAEMGQMEYFNTQYFLLLFRSWK